MITKKKKREELQLLSQEALDAYMNRPDFQYDANGDALYRHYKDQYTELGKRAMQDTMGQASTLTGGYGSSYAQSVGQQAYQSYLSKADDVIPTLYQLAYDRYRDKGDRLYKTYQSWSQLEQQAAQQEQWEREYELEERKRQDANREFQLEQERKNSQTQTSQTQTAAYHKLGQNNQSRSGSGMSVDEWADLKKAPTVNTLVTMTKTQQTEKFVANTDSWETVARSGNGYENYEEYLKTRIDSALSKGQLTSGEAAWLISYYTPQIGKSTDDQYTSDRFKQLQKQVMAQLAADVDVSYIESFLTDARAFVLQTEADIRTLTWTTATSNQALNKRNASAQAIKDRANKVRAWLDANKSRISQDAYQQYIQYLDDFSVFLDQSADTYKKSRAAFSRFATEEDYNKAVARQQWQSKYGNMSFEQIKNTLETLPDGDEKEWLEVYAPSLMTAEDYHLSFMTKDEIANYNYLYNVSGRKAANEYLAYLKNDLTQRRQVEIAKTHRKLATEHPGWADLYSVGATLASGIGLLDIAGQNAVKGIKEAITGEYAGPINYSSAAMNPNTIATSIRSTRAQNIANKYGVIDINPEDHPFWAKILNGKSFGDIYQLGMSMADSAAVLAMSPILGSYGTVLLGGSAGTQGVINALQNGATDEQALAMGVLNGFFEMFFEKFSLETLLSSNGRRFIDALWRQAVAEGSEELFTSAANNVADIIVMAEKSGYMKDVADYIEAGSSESEAMQKALLDMGIDMGWDFVGGLISGGIMGGGGKVLTSAKSTIENAEIGKSIMKVDGGVEALMNLANEVAGVTSADMQSMLTNQIDKVNQKPNARNVGQLYATVQAANNRANAAVNQTNTVVNQEDVAKSLRNKGVYSRKVDGLAEAIAARLNDQELTRSQRSFLSFELGSPAVQDVISEFIKKKAAEVDNVQSRGYDDSNIRDGLTNEASTTSWNLSNQSVDAFSNHDYAAITEDSVPNQPENSSSEGNYVGGGNALRFNNWDDMKGAYKGTITQFVKENKPKYSPEIRKWFDNGGSIEIQDIDGKQIWTYTSPEGISIPYIDGYIKFPDEYLNPTIKSVDIGEFTGDRGRDIDKMLSILQADYGIDKIPDGYTVHHDIVNGILQLVDESIHTEFTHIGGYSIYK